MSIVRKLSNQKRYFEIRNIGITSIIVLYFTNEKIRLRCLTKYIDNDMGTFDISIYIDGKVSEYLQTWRST